MEATPLKRLYNLLKLDRRDIYQLFFYAIFSGLISLTLPLGIQAIINFIQSGRVSVSWIVLIVVVLIGVAFGGILSLMQLRITENLQQKIFVRSSFDFAYRLPKIEFNELYSAYLPELANRFFDTMSIQKGTSKLLIDFSAALLQIVFGILLLSFYHPFFMVFGVLLIMLLYGIFKFSFHSGLKTSLNESKYKYKVAGWLQEMARNNFSFKKKLHFEYALQKNNSLVEDYIGYREKHFNVIKRQYIQLIIFKMIITASLLSIGGYLVLDQQMNIGQFVASEIVILMVINSVEKIVIGLETFYDVLTSIEKIGQVADMTLDEVSDNENLGTQVRISLELENVKFTFPNAMENAINGITLKVEQGEKVVVDGDNGSGKSTLLKLLAGYYKPTSGLLHINHDVFQKIDLDDYRSHVGSIFNGETPFEGTILENITLNDVSISTDDLKWAIEAVQLSSYIKSLPKGLDTFIFPQGKQLSASIAQKILLARCIIHKPKIIVLENPLQNLDYKTALEIIDFIFSKENNWTVIVSSKNEYWKQKCQRIITLSDGNVIHDLKK